MSQREETAHLYKVNLRKISEYSFSGALFLYAIGFIIASLHYSRFGVSPSTFSISLMLSSGVSMLLVTGIFYGLGRQLRHLEGPSHALEVILSIPFAILLLAIFFVFRVGFLIYALICLTHGLIGGRLAYSSLLGDEFRFARAPQTIMAFLLVIFLYGVLGYPNISQTLGGGAPQPVMLELSSKSSTKIGEARRVYEIMSTDSHLHLALEPENPPSRDSLDYHMPFGIPQSWPFSAGTVYVVIKRSQVRCIRYTSQYNLPLVTHQYPEHPCHFE